MDGAQEDIAFHILNTRLQFPLPWYCIAFPPFRLFVFAPNMDPSANAHYHRAYILKILGSWRLRLRNLSEEMTLGGNFDTLTDEASLVSELFSEKSPYYNITFHANWFWKEGHCCLITVQLPRCSSSCRAKPVTNNSAHPSPHQGLQISLWQLETFV